MGTDKFDDNAAVGCVAEEREEEEEIFQSGGRSKHVDRSAKMRRSSFHNSLPSNKQFGFMRGIKNDIRTRAPYYNDDWGKPKNTSTVINATLFAFVVQLIPALIFADLMYSKTNGNLGTAETLLSSGIIGVIYAVLAGQPLVLLGITGPVAILLGTSYRLSSQFDSEYWPFFWWLCIWTAVLHWLTAIFGLVSFVWHISPFTTQIFEFFIACTFIYESIRDLVKPLHLAQSDEQYDNRGPAYASLVIGMLSFMMCWRLHFAETWSIFPRQVRTILSSYNMAIVTVIVTALSYLPGVKQLDSGGLERVNVVPAWGWPSFDRQITNPMEGIGTKGIFGALFPAFMLYLLFFIDHNISSILTQAPKYNLQKPGAYHWDFFCLGLTIVPCGILGLPPGSGLIPQAPLHTRALATRKIVEKYGIKHEVTVHVEEQRWSAFLQAALMFVVLNMFVVLSWIPKGLLYGIFLYLGVGAMHGNEIFNVITLSFMYAHHRPPVPIVANIEKWPTVQLYTLIQVLCTAAIFGVANFASVGFIFPALIGLLVPIRMFIISRWSSAEDLKILDPISMTEDEAHDEKVLLMSRIPSVDEDEVEATAIPRHGDFHAEGIQNDIEARREDDELVSSTLKKRNVASTPDDNT